MKFDPFSSIPENDKSDISLVAKNYTPDKVNIQTKIDNPDKSKVTYSSIPKGTGAIRKIDVNNMKQKVLPRKTVIK